MDWVECREAQRPWSVQRDGFRLGADSVYDGSTMLLGALVIMLHSLVCTLPPRAVSLQAFEPRVPHAALRRDNRVRRTGGGLMNNVSAGD